MSNLLSGVSQYVADCPELPRGCSELEILAQLQHQGAATGLIDFTMKPLVALWFACSGQLTEDGAVYVLSRSDIRNIDELEARRRGVMSYFYGSGIRNDPPYLWSPLTPRGRAASQQSVFILGVPLLWPMLLRRVVVNKNSKPALLDELRKIHNISEDTLFADLAGYAHANSVLKPFDTCSAIQFWVERAARSEGSPTRAQAYVDCGLAHVEMKQYEQAIERYTEAIAVDPENIGAYVNRAGAKCCLGDYQSSLADYDAAIERLLKVENIEKHRIGRVYWDRGTARMKLGQEEKGCADQNQAIKLGLKMWVDDAGRITDRPEKYSQYRS